MRSSYGWEKYFLLVSSNPILYCGSHFSLIFLSRPPKNKLQSNLCHPWRCEIQYTHSHILTTITTRRWHLEQTKPTHLILTAFFAIFHFQFHSNYRVSISIIMQLLGLIFVSTGALLGIDVSFRFKFKFSWLALASWLIGIRLSLIRYLSVPSIK